MANEEQRKMVTSAYPYRRLQRIAVHIEDFRWKFRHFGPVDLVIDDERVRMHYVGFGSMKGTAMLLLQHAGGRYPTVDDLCERIAAASQVYLERAPDDTQPDDARAEGRPA